MTSKTLIHRLVQALRRAEPSAPVTICQVVLADVLGTGIDVVASRDMPAV